MPVLGTDRLLVVTRLPVVPANQDADAPGVIAALDGDRTGLMSECDLGLDLPDMTLIRPSNQPLHRADHVSLLALYLTDQRLGGTWPADNRIDSAGEPVIGVLILLLHDTRQKRRWADQVARVVPLGNQAVLNRFA